MFKNSSGTKILLHMWEASKLVPKITLKRKKAWEPHIFLSNMPIYYIATKLCLDKIGQILIVEMSKKIRRTK